MSQAKLHKLSRLSPEVRIAEILMAARSVLRERGYESFLPAEVAGRCGVSEGTIYRYFPTKRDLLLRVAEQWIEELLAEMPEIVRYHNVFEQLRYVIWHSLAIVRKEPSLTRYILLELRSDPSYRSNRIYELNRKYASAVSDVVASAAASGVFRKDISERLVRNMIFGCIEHQIWSYLLGQGDFSLDQTADDIAGIVFRGMAVDTKTNNSRLTPALDRLAATATSLQTQIGLIADELGLEPVNARDGQEETKT